MCDPAFPRVITVEPTTRCNMRCAMCVKSSMDPRAPEGDLSLAVFKRLESCLPNAARVIFSGVGEPLLNPELPEMIAFARRHLPPESSVAMQTNGLLLKPENALALVDAGLDTVCISLDSLDAADGESLHGAARIEAVDQAFKHLGDASKALGKGLRLGIEIVLMRGNVHALAELVRYAGKRGANFALVSHVFSYTAEAARASLFNPNPPEAMEYFEKWKKLAAAEGLLFEDYYRILWKVGKTEEEKRLMTLVRLMQQDANAHGVWMNVKSLFTWSGADTRGLDESLARTEEAAVEYRMELSLPAKSALHERHCGFMEDAAVFVGWRGDVSPCHFLWRDYQCVMDGEPKRVRAATFGSITRAPLEEIWRSKPYRDFRNQAMAYEYPFCSSCNGGPCSDITNSLDPFQEDCVGFTVPCCHCPWPVGQLACLS